jgi:hypothetical protein
MREPYVRPPLVPREPAPGWIAVWRFRLVAVVLLVVLVLIGYRAFRKFSGATDQDPGVNSMRTTAAR